MNYVVFDLETKTPIQGFDKESFNQLEISVAGVYEARTDKFHTFIEEEFQDMWPIFERADVLVGYNSINFDLPLLNKYYLGNLENIKHVDLMVAIQEKLGRRIKLDTVAEATLGKKKSGHGLEAVDWWMDGEVDKVRKYCEDDVRITKEIFDYALSNRHLKYIDGGFVKPIELEVSSWNKKEDTAMTQSLF